MHEIRHMRRLCSKGQISYFILSGIVILILFWIVYAIGSNPSLVGRVSHGQAPDPVEGYVVQCIEETGNDAIRFIGLQGGYYQIPKTAAYDLPFYYYKNLMLAPSEEELEKELAAYMDGQLFFCFRNFVDFKNQGMDIKQGAISSSATLTDAEVHFEVNLPLRINVKDTSYALNTFAASVEAAQLRNSYELAYNISAAQLNRASICLSCILDIAIEHNLHIDIQRIGELDLLFTITEKNNEANNPYRFQFVNRYDEVSCDSVPDYLTNEEKLKIVSECLEQKVDGTNDS